jgi:hypothetical protein
MNACSNETRKRAIKSQVRENGSLRYTHFFDNGVSP